MYQFADQFGLKETEQYQEFVGFHDAHGHDHAHDWALIHLGQKLFGHMHAAYGLPPMTFSDFKTFVKGLFHKLDNDHVAEFGHHSWGGHANAEALA